MEGNLNEFSTLHLKALQESSYYGLIKCGENYETYFVHAKSFSDVYNIFNKQINFPDGTILTMSFEDILGFYLQYHSLNEQEIIFVDEYNKSKNGKNSEIVTFINTCRETISQLKKNSSKIGIIINTIETQLANITPVEYKETEINEIQSYTFTLLEGKKVSVYDACVIFNSLKVSNRFPLIIYVNSIKKIISRINPQYSISFPADNIFKIDFPPNSLTLFSENGDYTIFDFNKGKFSMKIKSGSNDDRLKKLSTYLNMLEFKEDTGIRRIKGTVSFFTDKIINYYALYNFFITDYTASILFFVNEMSKPWCANDRFYAFFRDFGEEMLNPALVSNSNRYLRISIPTEKRDNKVTGFTINFSTKNREMIKPFLYKMSRLLNLITGIPQTITKNTQITKSKVYIKPIFKLNEHAPELFKIEKKIRGETSLIPDGKRYCRKCLAGMQPIIIEADEVETWRKYGREPKLFPPVEWGLPNQYWLVCPLEEFPNLNFYLNEQDVTGVVKTLPCCKKQEETDSKINNLTSLKVNSRPNITDAPNDLLGIGMLNDAFSNFLINSFNSDINIKFKKMGTSILSIEESILNSFITSIIIATGKNLDQSNPLKEFSHEELMKQAIIIRQKMAQLPTDIYKQELYDMSDNEIIESILNPKTFIDPYLYYRGLEILFGVQIFVFSSDKGRKTPFSNAEKMLPIPTLEIPRCKDMHIRHKNDNPILCIYKNYGTSMQNLFTIPTCELIVYSHGSDSKNYNKSINNNNTLFFDSIFKLLKTVCLPYEWYDNNKNIEETCLEDPYSTINWQTYDFGELGPILGQEIDMYGKTFALIFDRWTLLIPPTQPLFITDYDKEGNINTKIVRIYDNINYVTLSGGKSKRPIPLSIDEAKEVFEYSEEDIDGIWIPFNGIDKGIKVICISKSIPSEHAFNDCMKIVDRKNKTSILLQLVNWLWRSDWNGISFPVFKQWWKEHAVIDRKEIFNSIPDTLVNCNNMMLPELNSFDERIVALAKIWPFFFYGRKIHVSPNLFRLIENSFNIEDIYSRGLTPNDIYGQIHRFIIGLIPTDSDYKRNDDIILTEIDHIKDWINRNTSILYKYRSLTNANIIEESILPTFKSNYEPFLFKNKNGKIYIVQNSLRKSSLPEEAAIHIAQYWKDHGRNPGSYYNNSNLSINFNSIKYIAYTNTHNGISIYKNNTNGSTDYLEIFRYPDEQTFAALLPIL